VSRFRFIAAEQATSSVVRLCRILGVSTSGFYAWQRRQPSQRARMDAELIEHIRDIHADSHCTYGAPRVHAELRTAGTRVGKKRVARLMRGAGLAGRCPKRFRRTTIPSATAAAEPADLVCRDFNPRVPDRLWIADITYVRTWEGWLYLAVILDAFSRRVIGWALADHLRTELATAALTMAVTSRRPPAGLSHHSDRGVHTGFKGSSQRCRQELRCNSTNVGARIAHFAPECSRQVVRRWRVEKIGNASGHR
jgi:putative transposase